VEADYGSISINFITPSSTITGGTITTTASPQTSNSQNQFNNVNTALNMNGNIAGMQVISSTVSANGGNPTPSSSSSSTAAWIIAIAVVIPLVVLVAVGIGIYCYCKKKRAKQDES